MTRPAPPGSRAEDGGILDIVSDLIRRPADRDAVKPWILDGQVGRTAKSATVGIVPDKLGDGTSTRGPRKRYGLR